MKKALVYLAFSILILGLIISYDVTQCDGQVIMRHFIKTPEPTYEVYEPVKLEENTDPYIDYYVSDDSVVEHEVEVEEQETTDDSLGEEVGDLDEHDEQEDADTVTEVSEQDEHYDEDSSRGYEYYFGFLNDKEKQVYRNMYKAFSEIGSGNAIPTIDDEAMNRVAGYIRLDHPEFFYIKDMGYTHYTLGGQIQKTVLSTTYTDSKTLISMEQEDMETIANLVIASIPPGSDDYEKVKYVYEWIILNTDYDVGSPDNQSIKSVLLGKRSVCAGYARTLQYILNKIGVKTTFVEGKSLVTGENHAWNLCLVNDKYYYVDATWGDASYKGNDHRNSGDKHGINYDYLLVTTEELLRTHMIASDLPMPMCNATEDNYYEREGLILYGVDTVALTQIFDNAYANNQECVSFKCANLEIYDDVRKYLIRQNGVFEYLRGDTPTISYSENEEQRTICFWL